MKTYNVVSDNVKKIAELFPECISEERGSDGKIRLAIDFDKLHGELSDDLVSRKDSYKFTWPNKSAFIHLANSPITSTLRPNKNESKYFDTTKNVYIEGENLDVLKCIKENYLGQFKVIYIDPPYNTGQDFVYDDNYSMDANEFKALDGQLDEMGNRMVVNSLGNGQIHTDWLNMMYPRLKVAKQLLSREGVIFISIDYHEMHTLKMICNEIFGEQNFVGEIVWQTATDNNPTQISLEHEYILCYAKNLVEQPKWQVESEKAKKINAQYHVLKDQYGSDLEKIRKELKKWIKANEKDLQGATHYDYVDERGVYYPGNSSNTKPGGYTFDIKHPVTGGVCAKPEYGYRWTEKTFWDAANAGDVLWGEDENTIPKIKKRIETVTESLKSYYYEDNRYWTKYLNKLFGKKVFENPKSCTLLCHLLEYTTDKDSLVLDFFSGSASTAQAVMMLNKKDGGNRHYVLVQIPAETDAKSEARKAGYKTICEIGKERIRRTGAELQCDGLDTGFRVLKLDSSNMEDVFYTPVNTNSDLFLQDNIKKDRSNLDILFQVLPECNLPLSATIETKTIGGKEVFFVEDTYLVACFDKGLTEDIITEIAKMKPYYFVTADRSMESDQVADNFEQLFKAYSPKTERRII